MTILAKLLSTNIIVIVKKPIYHKKSFISKIQELYKIEFMDGIFAQKSPTTVWVRITYIR